MWTLWALFIAGMVSMHLVFIIIAVLGVKKARTSPARLQEVTVFPSDDAPLVDSGRKRKSSRAACDENEACGVSKVYNIVSIACLCHDPTWLQKMAVASAAPSAGTRMKRKWNSKDSLACAEKVRVVLRMVFV